MDSYDLFIQALGVIGACLTIYSFSLSQDKKFKIFLGFGALIIGTHFLLLGSVFGAISAILAGVRFISSAFTNNKNLMLCFLCVYVAMLFFIDGEIINYFPIIAGIIGTIALFMCRGLKLRFSFLICQLLWLIHNIIYLSIGGMVEQVFQIGFNIKTIRRLHKHD